LRKLLCDQRNLREQDQAAGRRLRIERDASRRECEQLKAKWAPHAFAEWGRVVDDLLAETNGLVSHIETCLDVEDVEDVKRVAAATAQNLRELQQRVASHTMQVSQDATAQLYDDIAAVSVYQAHIREALSVLRQHVSSGGLPPEVYLSPSLDTALVSNARQWVRTLVVMAMCKINAHCNQRV
jgi:hypothetical protein